MVNVESKNVQFKRLAFAIATDKPLDEVANIILTRLPSSYVCLCKADGKINGYASFYKVIRATQFDGRIRDFFYVHPTMKRLAKETAWKNYISVIKHSDGSKEFGGRGPGKRIENVTKTFADMSREQALKFGLERFSPHILEKKEYWEGSTKFVQELVKVAGSSSMVWAITSDKYLCLIALQKLNSILVAGVCTSIDHISELYDHHYL